MRKTIIIGAIEIDGEYTKEEEGKPASFEIDMIWDDMDDIFPPLNSGGLVEVAPAFATAITQLQDYCLKEILKEEGR